MVWDKTNNNQYKYKVRVKSRIHANISYMVPVDLYCYEKMPEENVLKAKEDDLQNLHCREKMPKKDLVKKN